MSKKINNFKTTETYIDFNNKLHVYLYGYLWVDGRIDKKNYTVSASSAEPEVIEKLKETFGGFSTYRKRIQKESGTIKNCYEWRLHKTLFCKDMRAK
jgi:hypothetical protein